MAPRNNKRILTKFPLRLYWERTDGGGQVLDLTLSGCRIRSNIAFNFPAHLRLTLQPPYADCLIKIELAAVRWLKDDEIGLEFLQIHAEHQKHLQHLIAVLQDPPSLQPPNPENQLGHSVEETQVTPTPLPINGVSLKKV